MSTNIEIVKNVIEKNSTAACEHMEKAIMERISTRMEVARQVVARNLFKPIQEQKNRS